MNISETVRLGSKKPPIGHDLWGIQWSRDKWRHVTPKGQTCDLNTLLAQYLENSWTCYLETIANCCCEAVRSAILATVWLLVSLVAVSCMYWGDHILISCIRFLDLENVCLDISHVSKMLISWEWDKPIAGFQKKQSPFWKSKMAAIGCLEKCKHCFFFKFSRC